MLQEIIDIPHIVLVWSTRDRVNNIIPPPCRHDKSCRATSFNVLTSAINACLRINNYQSYFVL